MCYSYIPLRVGYHCYYTSPRRSRGRVLIKMISYECSGICYSYITSRSRISLLHKTEGEARGQVLTSVNNNVILRVLVI